MNYLLFVIARIFGRVLGSRVEHAWQNASTDPDKLARQRKYEALVPTLKGSMTPEEWQDVRVRLNRDVQGFLPEWRVAERLLNERENAAKQNYSIARWGRNRPQGPGR